MVLTSLTTEGDTGPDSRLAVDRFPVADADGSLTYSKTFTLNPELDVADLADYTIVLHGIDLDDSGAYDGDAESSLDPSLPPQATIPANCGTIEAADGDDNGEEMDAPDEVPAGSGGLADTGFARARASNSSGPPTAERQSGHRLHRHPGRPHAPRPCVPALVVLGAMVVSAFGFGMILLPGVIAAHVGLGRRKRDSKAARGVVEVDR